MSDTIHQEFRPRDVCANHIEFNIKDGKIYDVMFSGGCNGNLKAIGKLIEGADAAEIADTLRGNTCGPRSTSCADQLAKAIDEALL